MTDRIARLRNSSAKTLTSNAAVKVEELDQMNEL